MKEIKLEEVFNDEKRDMIKEAILMHKSFEFYLLRVGEKSKDYAYPIETLYRNIEYFRECHKDNFSPYKALEFLTYEIDKNEL